MILSLGFGLVAAIGISQLMKANKANAQQPVQEMAPVLVAADVINMKTVLTEEHVRLENWPKSIVPEGVVTTLEEIKDMAAFKPLSKGAPIFKGDLRHKNEKVGVSLPAGFKLVSIKVNAEDHGAGILTPGDRVDVIGLFKTRKKNGTQQSISRTFLKALQVFSIDGRVSAIREMGDDEKPNKSGNVIVGLLATEKQAEQIFFVQRTGNIRLVYRGDVDESDDDVEDLSDIMNMDGEYDADDEPEQNQPQGLTGPFTRPNEPPSMIIYIGGEPTKVVFEPGQLPQRMSAPSAPAFGAAPEDAMREVNDGGDDFDGIEENEQRIGEDQ